MFYPVMVLAVDFLQNSLYGAMFEIVTKPVLITQAYFSCCRAVLTERQCPFCCSLCPASKEAGGAQKAGREAAGTDDQRDIPCCMTSCSAIKAGVRR